ncbi:MAG TPA: anaerobic glycerol-3-phosphate dehydrogenase subunit GlpA [Methanomassiliicoccales archaeon]|jgi:glycerol-3-phosphate dehydrogenase
MPKVDVLIIGAGVTGAGIARDLSMRGASVMLLDRGDFCSGASGSNHGMLHSGARYAVKDPESAKECASEANILRKIAPAFIEDTGGLFVSLPEDDFGFAEKFKRGCNNAGVDTREVDVAEAREMEPSLSSDMVRAFWVDDGSIDPFGLTLGNIEDARSMGAKVRNYCEVVGIDVDDYTIDAVRFKDQRTGTVESVTPGVVLNAAGAWSPGIAAMVGQKLPLRIDKGTLVVLNGRLCKMLVNRLRPPADGDIVVPSHSSTIIGTTSNGVSSADGNIPTESEVTFLLRETAKVIPGIANARAVRAYCGVRPLIPAGGGGRSASRNFRIIDHASTGVYNLVSVIGGKLTTYRLMAEKISDLACEKINNRNRCRTAKETISEMPTIDPVPGIHDLALLRMAKKNGSEYQNVLEQCVSLPRGKEEVCTCERVLRGEIQYHLRKGDVRNASDLVKRTRVGMGYCQGGFCTLGIISAAMGVYKTAPIEYIESFLNERNKGISSILVGEQLRQEMFKAHLLRSVYGIREESR